MPGQCRRSPSFDDQGDRPVDSPRSTHSDSDIHETASVAYPLPESDLDMLIEKARGDMYAHLQMTIDGHWSFCESSLLTLRKELESKTASIVAGLKEAKSDSGSDIVGVCNLEQDTGVVDKSTSKRVVGWTISTALKGATKGRNSKFVSRAAGDRQWERLSPIKRVVSSTLFDSAMALLIISNCVFMGFQVEESDSSSSVDVLQVMFCTLFTVELLLRLFADPQKFCGKDYLWNTFDTITVLGSIIELSLQFAATEGEKSANFLLLRCLRFLRFLRVARMLRVRAFRELRLMVQSMMCCVKPLTWTVSLLGLVLYIFAIVFTQATIDALRNNYGLEHKDLLQKNFSTMVGSMYVLLSFVLGGSDWLDYAVGLGSIHWGYKICLCCYVIFTQLALLNVVTAIFVDSSMNAALSDKQMLIQEEMIQEGVNKAELEKLFKEASEQSGTLTTKQLGEYLEDEQVKTYLKFLEIHYKDPMDLVRILDTNHDGTIDLQEFVKGCLQLKSQRVVDVHAAILENKRAFVVIKESVLSMLKALQDGQNRRDNHARASKIVHDDQVRHDMQYAVSELKTAKSTFNTASSQLQDSHGALQSLQQNLGSLHHTLNSAATNMDRVSSRVHECVVSTCSLPPSDQLSHWQQDLRTTQKIMQDQLEALLKISKQNEAFKLDLARSYTGTTKDDMTETCSGPTCPSPEVTNRSLLEETFKPTETEQNLNTRTSTPRTPIPTPRTPTDTPRRDFDPPRIRYLTRLGPHLTGGRRSLIAQDGDQDPPPTQPFPEHDSQVAVLQPPAKRDKSSRSCCKQGSDGSSFACLTR